MPYVNHMLKNSQNAMAGVAFLKLSNTSERGGYNDDDVVRGAPSILKIQRFWA